jgi:hypothetical protein
MGKLAQAITRHHQTIARQQLTRMVRAMQQDGQSMEQRMKSSHPWTNRTHNAEKSLGAIVDPPRISSLVTQVNMRVGYNHIPVSGAPVKSDPMVHYGIFLEKAHGQRFAIVQPTVSKMAKTVGTHARAARRLGVAL